MAFRDIYRAKRVLVTGHTGFKGSWLCEWLLQLGAELTGFAQSPPTRPALFEQLGLLPRLRHVVGDVRDLGSVQRVFGETQPDFVFHLAAQPLVRASYAQPVETYSTNVMGSVHVLEAARRATWPCTIVVVTSDKCYENHNSGQDYREEDSMGGHDPYSSSKGAVELVVSAYRRSYFSAAASPVRLASARAGNVIGGGDWAVDRIVPDCVRALQRGQAIPVRNRKTTRPWQHVLEPLGGYLWLAASLHLAENDAQRTALASAFNFGPQAESTRTVEDLVGEILHHWPGQWEDRTDPAAVHEAKLLNLSIDKARLLLGWEPVWDFPATIAATIEWYRAMANDPASVGLLTTTEIARYTAAAAAKNLALSQ